MQLLNVIGLIVAVATVALVGIAAIVATTAASLLVQSASATTIDVMTTTTPTTNVTIQGAIASGGGNNNNSNSNVTLGNLLAVSQGIDETYNEINDTYAVVSYLNRVTLMPPNATTTINTTETGNATVNIQPNGVALVQGQGFLVTQEDGDGNGEENATTAFVSLGTANPNGTGSRTGIAFFSTNSTGQLAFLDNMVGIYQIESSQDRASSRMWEWKGGMIPFENGGAPTTRN
jgi:hypothetical protein